MKQMEHPAGSSRGVNCWSKSQIMQRSCFICASWPMHLSSYIRSNLRPISRYAEQSTRHTIKRYFGIMHQQGCAASPMDLRLAPKSAEPLPKLSLLIICFPGLKLEW